MRTSEGIVSDPVPRAQSGRPHAQRGACTEYRPCGIPAGMQPDSRNPPLEGSTGPDGGNGGRPPPATAGDDAKGVAYQSVSASRLSA
jgi:hypothetical protein